MIEIPMVLIQQIALTIAIILAIIAQSGVLILTIIAFKEKDWLFFLIGLMALTITISITLVEIGVIVIV